MAPFPMAPFGCMRHIHGMHPRCVATQNATRVRPAWVSSPEPHSSLLLSRACRQHSLGQLGVGSLQGCHVQANGLSTHQLRYMALVKQAQQQERGAQWGRILSHAGLPRSIRLSGQHANTHPVRQRAPADRAKQRCGQHFIWFGVAGKILCHHDRPYMLGRALLGICNGALRSAA